MVKIMKKVIASVLVVALLCAVAVLFAGCGLFAKKVRGTEAAKILLARERLDSAVAGQKVDIFEAIGTSDPRITPTASTTVKIFDAEGNPTSLATGANTHPNGDSIEWSDFTVYSTKKDYYTQFIDDIDRRAAELAALIGKIKTEVGITDQWVRVDGRLYMLLVEESREMLVECPEGEPRLGVGLRYTTEDARNVYEMYNFWEGDGESGKTRLLSIPGERYEYMYRHSSGFDDYFIADRSCGFWQMNRFSFTDESAIYELSFVKDGIGYSMGLGLPYGSNGELIPDSDALNLSVFLPGEERDLFTVSTSVGGSMCFDVYMSNVKSGVTSLGVYGALDLLLREEINGTVTYHTVNQAPVRVNLANGQSLEPGDASGSVTYVGSDVSYSPEYNGNCYYAYMSFSVEESEFNAAYALFLQYLQQKGIALAADANILSDAYVHAQLLRENYDLTEWYGLMLDSRQNFQAAEQMLNDDYDEKVALYEKVKDYPTADRRFKLTASTNFESLSVTANGSPTYANGVITVTDLAATVSGAALLEEGVSYRLQIGLAKRNAAGEISSVHTVPLQAKDALPCGVFEKKSISLTQTAEFIVPAVLSEGEYIVVLYAATEEGIRVSEMVPVAFFSAAEGKLESTLMDVTVSRSGDHLFVDYTAKLASRTTTDLVQSSYTYADIERVLLHGVLAKGYPISEAVVQTAQGTDLATDGQYGAGEYRIKFLLPVNGVMVEAYMYCTFTTS